MDLAIFDLSDNAVMNIAENVLGLIPVALFHLMIPPVQYLIGGERPPRELKALLKLIYSAVPSDFVRPLYVKSLMFNTTTGSIRDSTIVTHLFVHHTYEHLCANLLGFLQFGYTICAQHGPLYMNALFLSGGVFASMPLDRYLFKFNLSSTQATSSPTAISAISNAISAVTAVATGGTSDLSLKSSWNSFVKHLGLSRTVLAYGSSGAVSALMGGVFMNMCHKLAFSIRGILSHNKVQRSQFVDDDMLPAGYKRGRSSSTSGDGSSMISSALDGSSDSVLAAYYKTLFEGMVGVGWIGLLVARELRHVQWPTGGESWDLSLFEYTTTVLVGHSTHVQGFIYGCIFTAVGAALPRLSLPFRKGKGIS